METINVTGIIQVDLNLQPFGEIRLTPTKIKRSKYNNIYFGELFIDEANKVMIEENTYQSIQKIFRENKTSVLLNYDNGNFYTTVRRSFPYLIRINHIDLANSRV